MEDLRALLIQGEDKDGLQELKLEMAYSFAATLICSYISENTIPEMLESIVKEITIMRFQRFGSEAVSEEKVDVVSFTYRDDYLSPYYTILDEYNNNNNTKRKKKVRFF